jgi:hypothetical protein
VCGCHPGVVDQHGDVGGPAGSFFDRCAVGEVEPQRDQPAIGDGADIADSGVDLGRASVEQVCECGAKPAVGAGDQRDASFDLHAYALSGFARQSREFVSSRDPVRHSDGGRRLRDRLPVLLGRHGAANG